MQNEHSCNIITEKVDLSLPFTFKYIPLSPGGPADKETASSPPSVKVPNLPNG
jgi:hypothetical protein